jgi:iron complex transport system ATP-binding protein
MAARLAAVDRADGALRLLTDRVVIEVDSLHASLGGRAVLSGIQLRVRKGEILGVLGPNGCGKSTLLRCIAGLLRPSSGEVRLDGTPVRLLKPKALARLLAFQAQESVAALGFSVRSIVEMGRLPHRGAFSADDARDAEIVDRSLDRMGISELADRAVETLSGGERQRVSIARALAQDAAVLVLDEPSNHLDVRHQFAVLDLVRELGLTTVITLHDLRLASRVCDTVALLHAGTIGAMGTPAEALTPASIAEVYQVGATVLPQAGSRELDIRLFPA